MTTTDLTLPNVSIANGHAVVSSLTVAEHFDKQHKDVLESIRRIASECPADFTERNFPLSDYTDPTGRTLPAFNLTRDGFTLLVMGFTGAKALAWKVRYIEAFNAMERQLLHLQETIARECAKHMASAFRSATLPPASSRPLPQLKQKKHAYHTPGASSPGVQIDPRPDVPHVVVEVGGEAYRVVEADGWRWWCLKDVAGSCRIGLSGPLSRHLARAGHPAEHGLLCKVRMLNPQRRARYAPGTPSAFLREDALLSWLRAQNPSRTRQALLQIGSIAQLGLPA